MSEPLLNFPQGIRVSRNAVDEQIFWRISDKLSQLPILSKCSNASAAELCIYKTRTGETFSATVRSDKRSGAQHNEQVDGENEMNKEDERRERRRRRERKGKGERDGQTETKRGRDRDRYKEREVERGEDP